MFTLFRNYYFDMLTCTGAHSITAAAIVVAKFDDPVEKMSVNGAFDADKHTRQISFKFDLRTLITFIFTLI